MRKKSDGVVVRNVSRRCCSGRDRGNGVPWLNPKCLIGRCDEYEKESLYWRWWYRWRQWGCAVVVGSPVEVADSGGGSTRKMRHMDRGESVWLPPLLVIAGLRVAAVAAVAAVVVGGLAVQFIGVCMVAVSGMKKMKFKG